MKIFPIPIQLTLVFVVLAKTEKVETNQPVLKMSMQTSAAFVPCDFEEKVAATNAIQHIKQSEHHHGHFQCGVRPHLRTKRIVGGRNSTFGAWPWQVLVRELSQNCLTTQYQYGGVLVSENYVITAAHWKPEPNGLLIAVFGAFDISDDSWSKKSIAIKVKQIIYHPEFNEHTLDNDLALLKLDRPIQYDTHIIPICLPAHRVNFTDRIATVSGWGRLRYGGRYPTVLQEVEVSIIENGECQEMIHKIGYTKIILPSALCAGYAEGGKDSCEGDSGGPLVIERSDKRWELVGTVSNGIKCAARFLPGIYMRASYHRLWIDEIIGAPNGEWNPM